MSMRRADSKARKSRGYMANQLTSLFGLARVLQGQLEAVALNRDTFRGY
jgi:hypothetical protein